MLAGIDHHVPATTVHRFCSSSLQALRNVFHAIKAGEGDQYIAAGVEAVSRFPQVPPFDPNSQLDGSEGAPYNVYIPMGVTAENVADALQRLARGAGRVGRHLAEPRRRRARQRPLRQGDRPGDRRPTAPRSCATTVRGPGRPLEKLAELQPAFKPDGTVTAGNACPLNDGAAALLVMSEEKANSLGLKPRARIVASTVAALRPEIMGLGPIPAIQKLLERTGMKIYDIDIVEINEAFAAQIVPCKKELGITDEQLNPFGGAIALGHPFGMTGARIMTTLLNGLEATDGQCGIESMCVAGGQGQAMLVERLNG